ncbi:MAG: GNAT family N-acetyltransferase [Ardenticatenia bacterium]|nr:MAG: GNAT family N-acetyltransferase [Ardenticatenia bacterium]
MVTQTLESNASGGRGIRPMDPMRDLEGIADLIEIAFADDMRYGGQQIMRDLRMMHRLRPLFWALQAVSPSLRAFFSGFVWIEQGRVVGNVTISRVDPHTQTWLISNVAVLPEYRRRGIARRLMEAAHEHIRTHGGRRIVLQVRQDNDAAHTLYESMGYETVGSLVDLAAHRPRPPSAAPPSDVRVRWPNARHWRQAYHLMNRVASPLVKMIRPPRASRLASSPPSPLTSLFERLGMPARRQWWAYQNGVIVGLAFAERNRHTSTLELFVGETITGAVEMALLHKALAFLRHTRLVRTEVDAQQHTTLRALEAVGFQRIRVLDQMVLPLEKPF